MNVETYFRDHWVTIEDERLERYRQSFRVTDANRALFFDPLGAAPGETVLDFGCGPGYISAELAGAVGENGFVHGIDLNEDLLEMARQLADDEGVGDRVEFHHVVDGAIPLPDESVDRVIFKSVLLYIPDVDATIAEAKRVLRPGGKIVTQDTDFWLSACTAYSREEWRDFLDATRPAFKDPTMGRNLAGALRRAGFSDIEISVTALSDDRGVFRSTLENFIGYARELATMPDDRLDAIAERADAAIDRGDWLFVLNFFQVNGTRS